MIYSTTVVSPSGFALPQRLVDNYCCSAVCESVWSASVQYSISFFGTTLVMMTITAKRLDVTIGTDLHRDRLTTASTHCGCLRYLLKNHRHST